MTQKKKIAIVYDWLDSWGGVERVLLNLHDIFPDAIFYTSYYDTKKAAWAKDLDIRTSFIQQLPGIIKNSRLRSTPLYPFAFESFDFTGYDLVISVTSSFAKGVITRPETKHICYMLTPPRFLWFQEKQYVHNHLSRIILQPYMKYLQKWDALASKRPDTIIAISRTVQDRIQKVYGIQSSLLFPPFDPSYWRNLLSPSDDSKQQHPPYYLIVSRLERYKSIHVAIQAFNDMPDRTLIIIGTGRERDRLKSISKANTFFYENLSDKDLARFYSDAKAFIMPQEEDFGYTALEAQTLGCPVIAYKAGGAQETVIAYKTGVFFDKQTVKSLRNAIIEFENKSEEIKLSLEKVITDHLKKFSKENFVKRFRNLTIPDTRY